MKESESSFKSNDNERLRIAMVCDFFYPNLGGVEMHIWCLSHCLIQRNHKVIVITHHVEGRKGIRYMTNGLKIYYLPMVTMTHNVTFPTFYSQFSLFREILHREKIQFVHGHQAPSTLMHECLLQAKLLGYKIVYTDHSLFGFSDAASIHLNKILTFALCNIDIAIAVSHTCRENLVLRAHLNPKIISVIPNAVDTTKFYPKNNIPFNINDRINIVIISRLVYRKGIDLIVKIIQILVKKDKRFYFIIGGDGNKKILLQEMREKYYLHDRMELLGSVPHKEVQNVLCRGHIFLNSSLTESFCIAILEAVSCGLLVISTKVGGIPEILPEDMIKFPKENTAESLVNVILENSNKLNQMDRFDLNKRVSKMYSWHNIAERTEILYKKNLINKNKKIRFIEIFKNYSHLGPITGLLSCIIVSLLYIYLQYLEWKRPITMIEYAIDFPRDKYITYLKNKNRNRNN